MKYLGIDYGQKRIGLAISDETGSFAFPLLVISNSDDIVEEIAKIIKEHMVGEIIVGESKNFDQKENKIMKEIKPFVKKLGQATGLPIHMYPEFLTSEEAKRLQGKNDMHDASAAALILKHFLEAKK